MARRALVEILGDASSFSRSLKQSAAEADKFGGTLKNLSVNARKSAETQVQASVKKDAKLRQEIVTYKELAAAAVKGSREQIAASNLAAKAQANLSRSIGVTARESHRLSSASKTVERDFAMLGRGAIYGSGAFHHLGRSVLYASTLLVGTASLTEAIKSSIQAATQARATMGQLATAVRNSGLSWRDYRVQVEAALNASGKLGYTQQQSAASFTSLIRATHDAAKASRDLKLAEDINRGTNDRIKLAAATRAIVIAEGGRTTGLTRLGIALKKGTGAQEALRLATIAYGGAAEKWSKGAAGAQDRLSVAIEETKVAIGTALLPTVTQLSSKLADWLDKSRNQARVQRDVKEVVHDLGIAVGVLKDAFALVTPVVKGVTGAVGGLRHALELLAIAFAAFKTAKLIDGIGGVGLKSKIAAGEVSALRGKLSALAKIGTLTIGIDLLFRSRGDKGAKAIVEGLAGGAGLGFAVGGPVGAALGAGAVGAFDLGHALGNALPKGRGASVNEPSRKLTPEELAAYKAGVAGKGIDLAHAPGDVLNAYIEGRNSGSKPFPTDKTGAAPAKATAAAAARPSLTGAQKLQIALAANPDDLAALGKQATNDRNAIAFLKRRFAEGKVDQATYVKLVTQAYSDLASTEGTITSIEQAAASKVASEANKQKAAREKAARAAAKAARDAQHAREKAAKDAKARIQAGQFSALGLGAKGTGQSPLKETLGHELSRVKKALAGTLLDTDKNTHLLAQVGKVLDGQFGALTDKTRAAVRKLLDTLDTELKKGKGTGFGRGGQVLSSRELTKGIGFASTTARKELEARLAAAFVIQGTAAPRPVHAVIHVNGVTDPDKAARLVANHLEKLGRHQAPTRRGPNAGRGRYLP